MKPLTMNEHLAIARDHGIPIPTFRYAGDSTSGVVHYAICDQGEGAVETCVEDLPMPAWGFGSCTHCWSVDSAASSGGSRSHELLALSQVAQEASDYVATAQVASVPGAIEALTPDERDDFLEDYANICYRLRRRTSLRGRSNLQDRWGNSADGADSGLIDHVRDLVDDLTRSWQRVIAEPPYRRHLQRDQPAGGAQLRIARRTPADWSLDPTLTRADTTEAVLLAEAPRVATHGDWEVVAWDGSLHRWTPPGTAVDCRDWTAAEVQHALIVCANNADPSAFADVIEAVRTAHAA